MGAEPILKRRGDGVGRMRRRDNVIGKILDEYALGWLLKIVPYCERWRMN